MPSDSKVAGQTRPAVKVDPPAPSHSKVQAGMSAFGEYAGARGRRERLAYRDDDRCAQRAVPREVAAGGRIVKCHS